MAGSVTRGAVAGATVGAVWIAGLFAATPLVGGFAPAAIANRIIFEAPGWLSTAAISLLGFYAKPILVATVVVGAVLASAAIGAAWGRAPRVRGRNRIATAVGIVLTAVLFLELGTGFSVGFVAGLAVATGVPYAAAWLSTETPLRTTRRRFLRRAGGVAVAGGISLFGLRTAFDRLADSGPSERVEEPLAGDVDPPSGDPDFDFDGMPPTVTPPEDHYVVDINVGHPTVDPAEWTLEIDGAVGDPYALSYDDLLAHEERVEQTTTMVCISNYVGGDLIGTGHWTGVPLSALVDEAGPDDGAVDVVTHAADGYSEAIPLEIVDREDILIAFGLGERTLAGEHGFPARLLVPGRYGMKMTKWITRIEVADADHEAYWEARGWDEEAVVETLAYVRGGEREGDRVVVGGEAFAGLETGFAELSGVEVSVDGGDTWHEAELEDPISPHARRRWRYAFDAPDEDEFEVVARAIEADGTVQTEEETSPTPSGATGWHRETVTV